MASTAESWVTVNKYLQEALHQYVPKAKHCISTQRKPLWMTERVKNKLKLKAAALKKYRQTKDEKDRHLYAKLQNRVKWEVRKAVTDFERPIAREAQKIQRLSLNMLIVS